MNKEKLRHKLYSLLDTRYWILDTRPALVRSAVASQASRIKNRESSYKILVNLCSYALMNFGLFFCGCSQITGYYNSSLYPQNVSSVSLEMFDNQTFRRGVEYELSDALAKRIEAETPYKIISSPDRADTVMTGQITSIDESILSFERETGRALEREVQLRAIVNWKNLKTGELLIDNQLVNSQATFSEFQNQDFSYASALAANNLAQKIVELMQKKW
jgi:hypothetical protein